MNLLPLLLFSFLLLLCPHHAGCTTKKGDHEVDKGKASTSASGGGGGKKPQLLHARTLPAHLPTHVISEFQFVGDEQQQERGRTFQRSRTMPARRTWEPALHTIPEEHEGMTEQRMDKADDRTAGHGHLSPSRSGIEGSGRGLFVILPDADVNQSPGSTSPGGQSSPSSPILHRTSPPFARPADKWKGIKTELSQQGSSVSDMNPADDLLRSDDERVSEGNASHGKEVDDEEKEEEEKKEQREEERTRGERHRGIAESGGGGASLKISVLAGRGTTGDASVQQPHTRSQKPSNHFHDAMKAATDATETDDDDDEDDAKKITRFGSLGPRVEEVQAQIREFGKSKSFPTPLRYDGDPAAQIVGFSVPSKKGDEKKGKEKKYRRGEAEEKERRHGGKEGKGKEKEQRHGEKERKGKEGRHGRE